MSRLAARGILRCCAMIGSMSIEQQKRVCAAIETPRQLHVLFVSPERLVGNERLRASLQRAKSRLAFLCFDEIHCVSDWSHDFRPSFMYAFRSLTQLFGSKPVVVGLTATASQPVIADLHHIFGFDNIVAKHEINRNLQFTVHTINERDPQRRCRAVQEGVLEAVRTCATPSLVYVSSQADADELAGYLDKQLSRHAAPTPCGGEVARKLTVKAYHAGLARGERTKVQRQFLADEVDVVVATVAFGMGIDKPNIRTVVHATVPLNVEAYVQETGRSGRDGKESRCHLLLAPQSYYELRKRVYAHFMSFEDVRAVTEAVLDMPARSSKNDVNAKLAFLDLEGMACAVGSCSVESAETIAFLTALHHPELLSIQHRCPKRLHTYSTQPRGVAAPNANGPASTVLEQLGLEDPVLQYCLTQKDTPDTIVAATSLGLELCEFVERVNELVANKKLRVTWSTYCHLAYHMRCASDSEKNLIVKEIYHRHKEVSTRKVRSLAQSFAVLSGTRELLEQAITNGVLKLDLAWEPPPAQLSKADAVLLVHDFFEHERERIASPLEAAKALVGVTPWSSCGGRAVECHQVATKSPFRQALRAPSGMGFGRLQRRNAFEIISNRPFFPDLILTCVPPFHLSLLL